MNIDDVQFKRLKNKCQELINDNGKFVKKLDYILNFEEAIKMLKGYEINIDHLLI